MTDVLDDVASSSTSKASSPKKQNPLSFFKDIMERKIPTLPTFPSDRQLDGKNYTTWVMQMEAVLESYDMAAMVLEDIPRPLSVMDLGKDDGDSSAYKWDRLNARIRSFIILNCTTSVLAHIRHLTSARQIWLFLNQMYNRMTPMKRAGLEVNMRQLDPSKCTSMKDYIDKLQIMQQEIMHAGKNISSEDMAILLLSKLTSKYGAFYSSLITSGRMTELTWEELVPMVLDQEDRFKATSTKSDTTALTSQAKTKKFKGKKTEASSSKSPASSTKPSERTCHKCGEKGHIRKDCPKVTNKEKSSTDAAAIPARASAFVHLLDPG